MKMNIPTFAIIALLCFLPFGLSNAKPTDNERSPLKDKGKIPTKKLKTNKDRNYIRRSKICLIIGKTSLITCRSCTKVSFPSFDKQAWVRL